MTCSLNIVIHVHLSPCCVHHVTKNYVSLTLQKFPCAFHMMDDPCTNTAATVHFLWAKWFVSACHYKCFSWKAMTKLIVNNNIILWFCLELGKQYHYTPLPDSIDSTIVSDSSYINYMYIRIHGIIFAVPVF